MSFSDDVAHFFSALGDPYRIKILGIIFEQPRTVNEIKDELGNISLQALSYQLRKLEEQRLIKFIRDENDHRKKYYSLADTHVLHILNDTILHIKGSPNCQENFECDDYVNINLLRG